MTKKSISEKESSTKKTCFIIMPITTPDSVIEYYNGDKDHFKHVMEHLFIPAIEDAGFKPILPVAKGSDVIHLDIIKNLEIADFVLVDMSILNPNVFFEMGIRTALNKPTSLIVDNNMTFKVPFDTSIINYHKYDSNIEFWNIEKEKEKLTNHIKDCVEKTPDFNSLWNVFGLKEYGKVTEFKGSKDDIANELILMELRSMKSEIKSLKNESDSEPMTPFRSVIPKQEKSASWKRTMYSAQRSLGYPIDVLPLTQQINLILGKFFPSGYYDVKIDISDDLILIVTKEPINQTTKKNILEEINQQNIRYDVQFSSKP